jgi:hypothetical protein
VNACGDLSREHVAQKLGPVMTALMTRRSRLGVARGRGGRREQPQLKSGAQGPEARRTVATGS